MAQTLTLLFRSLARRYPGYPGRPLVQPPRRMQLHLTMQAEWIKRLEMRLQRFSESAI